MRCLRWASIFAIALASVFSHADDPKNRGEKLFSEAGCANCHTNKRQNTNNSDVAGLELPDKSRLMTKLRALAAILQDKETNTHLKPESYCFYYADFRHEYGRIQQLIHDGNPIAPMPSWQQRADKTANGYPDQDIASIMQYLLTSEGLSVDAEKVAQWLGSSFDCKTSMATGTIPDAPGPTQIIGLGSNAHRRSEILENLNDIASNTSMFRDAPSVSFMSYQNFLYNKISLVKNEDMDIWLLRQADITEIYNDVAKITLNNRFPNFTLFVIAVDKETFPYRAYFFQRSDTKLQFIYNKPKRFLPLPVVDNRNPLQDAASNGCFECHASGAIRLRPRQWETIPMLTHNDWLVMREMNNRILGYGAMTTDIPVNEETLDEHDREQLNARACVDCHNTNSIRAPILRYHSKIVLALMNAHERADGYFEYGLPLPSLWSPPPRSLQTTIPSIAPHQPAAMPPLMPLSNTENYRLFQWLGPSR